MKKIENTALQMIAEASRCPDYGPDMVKSLMKKLDMVDHLEEQERPATIIKTLLKHAKIQVDQAAKAFEHASRQQVLGESR